MPAAPSLRDSPAPRAPSVGDWIVIQGSYSFDVQGPVTAVTEKQVRYHWFSRERRADSASVLFAGCEKACRDLASTLISSRGKREAEQFEAHQRHQQRVAKAVASASARKDGSAPQSNEAV